jgi:hypothetical protein
MSIAGADIMANHQGTGAKISARAPDSNRNERHEPLSWKDTFKDMARAREVWNEFDGTTGDGLDPAERW